jgi:hypothetical protein
MIQRLSRIFQPSLIIPKNAVTKNQELSKSQRLMIECGLIKHSENTGCFYLTPIMLRSLEKLTNLVDKNMKAVNGQRMVRRFKLFILYFIYKFIKFLDFADTYGISVMEEIRTF